MKTKKRYWLLALLVVILTVVTPLAGALAAPAADEGEADVKVEAGQSYAITSGRFGAFLNRAPRSGIVKIERVSKADRKLGLGEHKFIQGAWKIGYVNDDDDIVAGYNGLVRLSFSLTREYQRMWQDGELAFYISDGDSWSRCNARLIDAGAHGTLVCDTRDVSQFGLVKVVHEED